jgi:hypothetical protein
MCGYHANECSGPMVTAGVGTAPALSPELGQVRRSVVACGLHGCWVKCRCAEFHLLLRRRKIFGEVTFGVGQARR